jgi:hypothetical protein
MPCNLLVVHWQLRGMYCFHLKILRARQDSCWLFDWLTPWPWKLKQYISLKWQQTSTRLHGITCKKIVFLMTYSFLISKRSYCAPHWNGFIFKMFELGPPLKSDFLIQHIFQKNSQLAQLSTIITQPIHSLTPMLMYKTLNLRVTSSVKLDQIQRFGNRGPWTEAGCLRFH